MKNKTLTALKASTALAAVLFIGLVLAKMGLAPVLLDYTLPSRILKETTAEERSHISEKFEPSYLIIGVTFSIAALNIIALTSLRKT